MKLVIQRVKKASVTVDNHVIGQIKQGMLVLIGVGQGAEAQDADALVKKISELRIFDDENGKMNLSAKDVNAEFLIVSQFTLLGDYRKGRRPSFDKAAAPEKANELYEYFVEELRKSDFKVETGEFGAMMDVALVNDGPVTFVLES